MKDTTKPTFKQTKLGILSIAEIEHIIFDNLILVQKYMYQNFESLEFSIETLCSLHGLLCSNIFDFAGKYRQHNVQMGTFEPISFVEVSVEMKKLADDVTYRIPYLQTEKDKKEFLAQTLRKILRIHPFADYNARVTRLFGELFLLQQHLPSHSFAGTARKDFAEAMKKATFQHDFTDIIRLIG